MCQWLITAARLATTLPAHAVWIGKHQGRAGWATGTLSVASGLASFDPMIRNGRPTFPHLAAMGAIGSLAVVPEPARAQRMALRGAAIARRRRVRR